MTRLKIHGVDSSKCIKCELCLQACSVKLFSVKREGMEKNVVFDDPYGFCFRCGHCISICPTHAINFEGPEEPFEFEEAKNPEKLLSPENYFKFIRSRRSIRLFLDKPVEDEKLEFILESMRYSPSASNRQKREYLVITNPSKIKELSKNIVKLLKLSKFLLNFRYLVYPFLSPGLRRRVKNPKTKKNLENYLERTAKGEDMIFFDAPCVIVLHAVSYSKQTSSDASIAITHGMLAALTQGLGTCWIGFAHEHLSRFKRARRKLGIPNNHDVYGVFVVGYPKLKFERVPPRRKEKIRWIE